MNVLCSFASIVAGSLAVMMTVVSWRVLKGNPVLDNPVIHVGVGVLTFIGLRYRPGGLIGQILLGYEAVAISILFLLLWMAFQKVRRSPFSQDIAKRIEQRKRRSDENQDKRINGSQNDNHLDRLPRDNSRQ